MFTCEGIVEYLCLRSCSAARDVTTAATKCNLLDAVMVETWVQHALSGDDLATKPQTTKANKCQNWPTFFLFFSFFSSYLRT